MADKNLSLGTIFTGKVDKTFKKATRDLLLITGRLTVSMGKLNKAMKGTAGAAMQYKRSVDKAATSTGRLGEKADFTGKQMKKVEGAWKRFTGALKVTLAYGIAATGLYKIVEALQAGIREIIDYDQALKNLQAITNATGIEVSAMGESIKDVARVTKFSTGEVATGMVLLAQAGFSATEATQAIDATAKLATGTLSSMAYTADLLTTTIRAFGLEAVEASRVSDVMANAINRSKLTIEKLRISFNFVGAAAAQVGLSLEETAASMMILANHGLRASTIGTGLRQVLSRLMAPNRKLRDAFEAHGIALDDVNPRLVGFQKALKNIAPILWDNKKKVIDMGKAFTLFGLRGAQAAAVLTKGFLTGDYEDMLEKVYEFGSATRMAEKQAEGLGVMLKNLADRAKLVAIALGEAGLTEMLRSLIRLFQNLTGAIESFIKTGVGRFTMQVGFLLVSLTLLSNVLVLLVKSFTKIAGVIGFTASLFSPYIVVIAGLAAGYIYLSKNMATTTKQMESEANRIGANISSLELYGKTLADLAEKHSEENDMSLQYENTMRHLLELYPELKDEVNLSIEAYEKHAKAVKKFTDKEIQDEIDANIELIRQYKEEAKDAAFYTGLWVMATVLLKDKLKSLKDKLKSMKGDFEEIIVDPIDKLFDKILPKGWGDKFKKGFAETFDKAGKSIKTFKIGMEELGESLKEGTEDADKAFISWVKIAEGFKKQGPGYDMIALKLRNLGASAEMVARVLEKLWKKKGDEFDPDAEKVKTEALRKAELNLERKYLSLLLAMETDVRAKIQANYNKRMADIEKYYNERVVLLRKSMTKEEAERVAGIKRSALEGKAEGERSRKTLDFETKLAENRLRIEIAAQKSLNEIKLKGAIGDESSMRRVREEVIASDIELQKRRVALAQTHFDRMGVLYDADADEHMKAELRLATEKARLRRLETKGALQQARERTIERRKELKYQLDHVKRFGEEYVALLDEAYELHLLSYEEYMARLTAATKDWWENFKYGADEAAKSLETFTEVAQRIGRDIVDVFATDLTSAIWDFAEGTKTLKDAMEDFAKSTIRWLGEIITKWAIMNAITGMFPSLGPAATPGTKVPVKHKGGIVGVTPSPVRIVNPNIFANAPRLHGGLASDEMPAILQKGETVLPKGGGVTVNVINKSGVPLDVTQEQQRFDAGEMILDVVVDAANRNKRGFRDNMKGMLR